MSACRTSVAHVKPTLHLSPGSDTQKIVFLKMFFGLWVRGGEEGGESHIPMLPWYALDCCSGLIRSQHDSTTDNNDTSGEIVLYRRRDVLKSSPRQQTNHESHEHQYHTLNN